MRCFSDLRQISWIRLVNGWLVTKSLSCDSCPTQTRVRDTRNVVGAIGAGALQISRGFSNENSQSKNGDTQTV